MSRVSAALEGYLRGVPEAVASSPQAATARVLADRLDEHGAPAYAVAAASREFREVLAEIRQMAPPKPHEDDIERARRARAARLDGKPAAGAPASS